jgi:hypothetical protein
MTDKTYIIVTSIAAPNATLRSLANGCMEQGYHFIVIGDQASPADFHIDGCDFYSLERQKATGFKFARVCPTRHYARKNIGYLLAMRDGASLIIETDDDNVPYRNFWFQRKRTLRAQVVEGKDWVNVYRYFSNKNIWPRGFPLELVHKQVLFYDALTVADADCPIQQGLVNDNPDVDAVYRLIMPLPQTFRKNRHIALSQGCWCPFNSQNTAWWPDVFKLLYLPSCCSFRMTDIWRSFIAQRIVWLNGWKILFYGPDMGQSRNVHNLLRDFSDEIPGYLHNDEIRSALENLPLESGAEKISNNLRICYQKLVGMSLIGADELKLLDAWLDDIHQIRT